jgi:hypothetical protein
VDHTNSPPATGPPRTQAQVSPGRPQQGVASSAFRPERVSGTLPGPTPADMERLDRIEARLEDTSPRYRRCRFPAASKRGEDGTRRCSLPGPGRPRRRQIFVAQRDDPLGELAAERGHCRGCLLRSGPGRALRCRIPDGAGVACSPQPTTTAPSALGLQEKCRATLQGQKGPPSARA